MTQSEPRVPASSAGIFGSSLSAVLTLAGVAIGLSNVWRFPFMMGSFGGSAFLFLYLLLMLVIAVPAMTAELSLARHCRGATIKLLWFSFGNFDRLAYLLVAGVAMTPVKKFLGCRQHNGYFRLRTNLRCWLMI